MRAVFINSLDGGQQKPVTHPTYKSLLMRAVFINSLDGGQQKPVTHPTYNDFGNEVSQFTFRLL